MKRIFIITIIAAIIFTLFALPCLAVEDVAPENEAQDGGEGTVQYPVNDDNGFYDRVIGLVTDGAFWAKFAAITVGVLALLVVVKTNLAKIRTALGSIKEYIGGKATREETEAAVKAAAEDMKSTFDEQRQTIEAQYDELAARNDRLTAILSLITIQLVKNPNARTQIMQALADTRKLSGGAAEIIEAVENEIKAAEAAEEKAPTPALDAVKARASDEAVHHMNLG